MAAVYYPVGRIVPSLGHPLGNITEPQHRRHGRRLELLRELVPTIRRAAVLSHVSHASNAVQLAAIESAHARSGVQHAMAPVRAESDFERIASLRRAIACCTPIRRSSTAIASFLELAGKSGCPPSIRSGRIDGGSFLRRRRGRPVPALGRAGRPDPQG
ncbi:MAG: hypothetical protein U1F37_00695 [Alphaproteobacteria bacterium]